MNIGKYNLAKPVFMAPMAGITDKAFREIIHLTGGKYCFTEMISDKALCNNNLKTIRMLNLEGEDEPRIVQIFGSEAESMADAAEIAVGLGAGIIDINMGCPTPKIVKNGEGAALLRNIKLAEKIADKVIKRIKVPVSVKMRLGWDKSNIVAPDLAARLEAVGVGMITVHGRTREQFYSGKADWDGIRKVKKTIQIPVVGNGDVNSVHDAFLMTSQTGCDGVMIGRAALGNPWLIARAQNFLDKGELQPEPGEAEKLKILLLHFEKLILYKGKRVGVNEVRKHAAWYIKGTRDAAALRKEIMITHDPTEMIRIFQRVFSMNNS